MPVAVARQMQIHCSGRHVCPVCECPNATDKPGSTLCEGASIASSSNGRMSSSPVAWRSYLDRRWQLTVGRHVSLLNCCPPPPPPGLPPPPPLLTVGRHVSLLNCWTSMNQGLCNVLETGHGANRHSSMLQDLGVLRHCGMPLRSPATCQAYLNEFCLPGESNPLRISQRSCVAWMTHDCIKHGDSPR